MSKSDSLIRGASAAFWSVQFFRDPVACMRAMHARFGTLVRLGPILPVPSVRKMRVLAVGPEFNRQVLGEPDDFRTTGQMIRGPAGSAQRRLRFGLTRMNGPQHKRQRQLIMPPFARKAVAGYHAMMAATAEEIVGGWKTGETRDLYGEMKFLALNIASRILFSPKPAEALAIARKLERWLARNFSAPVWLCPVDFPGSPYRALLRHAELLEKDILTLIARRRENSADCADVLSILVQSRDDESRGMSDEELIGQTTILFGASYETSASTLTWTIFLLLQHPEILRAVLEESDAVLEGVDVPEPAHLPRLELLDRVIKESMRILPPVPFTIRAATRDLQMAGRDVPGGSIVICSHYLTHHLAELYPEPERFLPDRWLTINPTSYEYMPFSAGPRMCIGVTFAMQMMKIVLTTVLRRFRLELPPGLKVDRTVKITMSPRHAMPVKLCANDRKFTRTPVRGDILEMVRS